MSVFITPTHLTIPGADVLCALLLLAVLCLKIMTLKQDSLKLAYLNRTLSLGLYPMSLIFGLLLLEWAIV